MTTIAAARGVLAEHRYPQHELTEAFARVCTGSGREAALLRRFHRSAKVRTRYLALPLEQTCALTDFGAKVQEQFGNIYLDRTDLTTRAAQTRRIRQLR